MIFGKHSNCENNRVRLVEILIYTFYNFRLNFVEVIWIFPHENLRNMFCLIEDVIA